MAALRRQAKTKGLVDQMHLCIWDSPFFHQNTRAPAGTPPLPPKPKNQKARLPRKFDKRLNHTIFYYITWFFSCKRFLCNFLIFYLLYKKYLWTFVSLPIAQRIVLWYNTSAKEVRSNVHVSIRLLQRQEKQVRLRVFWESGVIKSRQIPWIFVPKPPIPSPFWKHKITGILSRESKKVLILGMRKKGRLRKRG